MISENRFKVVFDKLAEVLSKPQDSEQAEYREVDLRKSGDEIAELRRAVFEISEPPVSLFTTT